MLFAALIVATIFPSDRDHGSFENGVHTACCLAQTPVIRGLAVALGISASLSGVSGMYLSLLAGSNFRALTYIGRAVVVLALQVRSSGNLGARALPLKLASLQTPCMQLVVLYAGLALHDTMASGTYGSPWTWTSTVQAVCFAVIIGGGAVTWKGRRQRSPETAE